MVSDDDPEEEEDSTEEQQRWESAPISSSSSQGLYYQQPQQNQEEEEGVSKGLEALELILQKILRSLCALADNFDRIVTSLESDNREVFGGWSWSGAITALGNGLLRLGKRGFGSAQRGDRSSLWVCSALLLLLCFVVVGFRGGKQPQQQPTSKSQDNPLVFPPPQQIQLPDGRNVSYREQGVVAAEARHSILVVHGFLSSSLAGIPGINSSLLEGFGVRLVAYDLPGFGESDIHKQRDYNTSAWDMVSIADALGLGEHFWLLAFSEGGPHAWAAIRHIPHRLAGVAMVAPAGNPYGSNLTSEEAADIWNVWSFRRRLLHFNAKRFPSLLPGFLRRTVMNRIESLHRSLCASVDNKKDEILLQQAKFLAVWEANLRESMKQQRVFPLAQELLLLVNDWGFDLGDLRLQRPPVEGFMNKIRSFFSQEQVEFIGFQRPIHIWQGTEDAIVPPAINEFAKRLLPHVDLHKLEGEGHFSWFYLCEDCHRRMFEDLFGKPQGRRLMIDQHQDSQQLAE